MCSFFHGFFQTYTLNNHHVPTLMVGAENIGVGKSDQFLLSQRFSTWERRADVYCSLSLLDFCPIFKIRKGESLFFTSQASPQV